MNAHPIVASVLIGYLLGSIPFGYMLVRIFRGADVRTTGSGNIGATNVARTSPLLGLLTLLLDAAKGLCAVAVILATFPGVRVLAFIAAFSSICGHIFPVWLSFRGGKGVATGMGSFLLLTPKSILIAIGVFFVVTALFRWVALGSIAATILLPAAAWALREACVAPTLSGLNSAPPMFWMVAGSALIIVKHRSNIHRILNRAEPRLTFYSHLYRKNK